MSTEWRTASGEGRAQRPRFHPRQGPDLSSACLERAPRRSRRRRRGAFGVQSQESLGVAELGRIMHDLVFLGRFHLAEMRVDLADDRVARAVQLKRPTTVRRRDSQWYQRDFESQAQRSDQYLL